MHLYRRLTVYGLIVPVISTLRTEVSHIVSFCVVIRDIFDSTIQAQAAATNNTKFVVTASLDSLFQLDRSDKESLLCIIISTDVS